MKSLQHIQENSQGERLQEGWNTVFAKEIKYIETKKGNALLIKMMDDENRVATDFLYEDTEDNARIAQLAEVAGITAEEWYDGISGDEVAKMLEAKLFRFNVRVVWGKGDGCFVKEYAPESSQQQTQAPKPQPTQQAAPAAANPGRSGKRF